MGSQLCNNTGELTLQLSSHSKGTNWDIFPLSGHLLFREACRNVIHSRHLSAREQVFVGRPLADRQYNFISHTLLENEATKETK